MNEIDDAESAFAEACQMREDAYDALRVLIANQGSAAAVEAALADLGRMTNRARDAKRRLSDARVLAELQSPPAPYVPGDPLDEAAWVDRLSEEWSDAARRIDSIRDELDAVPEVDLGPLDDPRLPPDERDRLLDASQARTDRIIPLLHALESAEKDYETADAALRRIEGLSAP